MSSPWVRSFPVWGGTMSITVGDALTCLREMPAASVRTCITSPPYFGLRDYGTGEWVGGDEGCDHSSGRGSNVKQTKHPNADGYPASAGHRGGGGGVCLRCGAVRADLQLGLEATPGEYISRLVDVFREVRRVLRDDGTVWLNIGDSYNTRSVARPSSHQGGLGFTNDSIERSWAEQTKLGLTRLSIADGDLKEKDLLGIPWMLAFALRADGWYLRSEIVWAKPNAMPESVTDRPTSAHEKVFLFSKQPRYFYDADAIREPHTMDKKGVNNPSARAGMVQERNVGGRTDGLTRMNRAPDYFGHALGRNKRNVWTVATQPFAAAHFAVFPPKLVEPCVLAGSAPGDVVLDPFAGSGTVGVVCGWYGRDFEGIELNLGYAELARRRIAHEGTFGHTARGAGEQVAGQMGFEFS